MTGDRDLPDIAEALEAIGMTAEEGRVYLHLLQAGPSKVGQLAPYFDVSRSKLYRLLDDLSRKGFVSKTPTRPTVYHPVFPEDAFELGHGRLEQRQAHLEAVEDEILPSLRQLHQSVEGPQPTDWNKIEETEQIYGVLQRVLAKAERSAWVASNQEPAVSPWLPFVQETWSTIERKVQAGLEAKVLLGPTVGAFEDLPAGVFEKGATARVLDVEHPIRFVVADERVVLSWVETASPRTGGSGEAVAIHTDAGTHVGMHLALFERLWAEAPAPKDLDQAVSPSEGPPGHAEG